MKANEAKFLDFLKGPKQFIIPIYQRTYSWTHKQCDQLWKDIVKSAMDESISGHFVGSIVYIEKGLYHISTIPQLLVIDGQQRLTTLSLLLTAFGKAISGMDGDAPISEKKLKNYFLLNIEEEDEQQFKLLLTRSDKQTLTALVGGKELPEDASKRIAGNYQFFVDQIANSGISPAKLYEGISKLIIVDIALNREHDNPQLIFESLNSTGLELSQADLIRNYVLMGQPPKEQEALYFDFWFPMERSFGQVEYISKFDRFMRDYLTIKTGKIPNIREVYEAFKSYATSSESGTIQEIVAEIYCFSKHFVKMALEKEPDNTLRQIFSDINLLKVDVAYPLLLEIYDDYKENILDRDSFIGILKLIESYVFRRVVCGIPTNSLNKTFATLQKEIDKDKYLESATAAFALKDSYRRFPDEKEFEQELCVKNMYNFRSRNYWLGKLENFEHKEKINIEEYTIEHIMPQNENLSFEWRQELGENWEEVHARYLHTLGNLTLTGYNSELSDNPFKEKRDMVGGFADSPLRLNKSLAKLDHWNEAAIVDRAKKLADKAKLVWQYPTLAPEILDQYRKTGESPAGPMYTMEDHQFAMGPMADLFARLQKRLLNLDSSVREEILKFYIAYKTTTNFTDVVIQKSKLRITFNLKFDEIDDPKKICRDISEIGRWTNGEVEIDLDSPDQLDYVMFLVKQAFAKHAENGD